jgi:hypothetical protein
MVAWRVHEMHPPGKGPTSKLCSNSWLIID